MSTTPHRPESAPKSGAVPARLALAALGVVFGDIGTSPLYAVRECFHGPHSVMPTPDTVRGVLSLLLWVLTVIVAVKYVLLLMRVDNRGEGGIFTLLASIRSSPLRGPRRRVLLALGLFGGALLYGDGVITPSISVLGALEGVTQVAPALQPGVLPVAVIILIGLFAVQSRGTASVGTYFGPIILLWFFSIAALGIRGILMEPSVLYAFNPAYAIAFFVADPGTFFVVLSAALLVVTGAEALYADMGHFGARPIRRAWFVVVLPALLLNYLGQGGLLLSDPTAASNPFYRLVPSALLIPMIVLATAAAVIASQALISGTFSLTHQAIQLGYCPRLVVMHTSADIRGQIYVPAVNGALMVGCVTLVLAFESSAGLAAAYGVAVAALMFITTILAFHVVRERWGWSAGLALAVFVPLGIVDTALLGSALLKIPNGGWIPLVIATFAYLCMSTWSIGRTVLNRALAQSVSLERTLANVGRSALTRVPGTAVFLMRAKDSVPIVLLHHIKHNKVLHERVVLFTVLQEEVPFVDEVDRLQVEVLEGGFWRVVARAGFMEHPMIPALLERCEELGLTFDPLDTTFYMGRETLLATGRSPLPHWRKRLFALLSRNATPATRFFGLPPNRVVELGAQIEL